MPDSQEAFRDIAAILKKKEAAAVNDGSSGSGNGIVYLMKGANYSNLFPGLKIAMKCILKSKMLQRNM